MDSSSAQAENGRQRDDDDVILEETDDDIGSASLDSVRKRKKFRVNVGSSPSKTRKRNAGSRSWVWDHFTKTKEDKNKCGCNYCGRIMCCSSANGTSCLKKHLKSCKAFKVWEESEKQNQHILNPNGEGGQLKLARVSEAVFREASNELLILAELPLAFIESLAWRYFCNKVNLYKPHSRRTATRDIIELYLQRKTALMQMIRSSNQRLSLTTNIWVAPTTSTSYMVITAHFIDASWKLRKLIIGFKPVSDHTGATISDVLLECMAEWGIKKIFTVTVDNATANNTALRKFKDSFGSIGPDALVLGGEYMHLRCAAHIINLVVQDGLSEVDTSVSAIRNAIHYVRGSSKRVDAFEQKVESGKMTGQLKFGLQDKMEFNLPHAFKSC